MLVAVRAEEFFERRAVECGAFLKLADPFSEVAKVVFHYAFVNTDEEGAGAAGRVEEAELGDLGGRLAFELATDGLLDNVIHDVTGRVVNAAGFADLGLVLDGGATALGAEDFAEEAFVSVALDLDLDVGEVVALVVGGELVDEVGEPLVADNEILGEMLFEELAVEEGLVGGRALVEGADVGDEGAVEASFGGRGVAGRRRLFLDGFGECLLALLGIEGAAFEAGVLVLLVPPFAKLGG